MKFPRATEFGSVRIQLLPWHIFKQRICAVCVNYIARFHANGQPISRKKFTLVRRADVTVQVIERLQAFLIRASHGQKI
jgi:hypothetical protein